MYTLKGFSYGICNVYYQSVPSEYHGLLFIIINLVPVVQRMDNAICRINCYPVDSAVCFVDGSPLDSDLSIE